MFIADLHQDWSENALFLSHKDFFKENKINDGWNILGIDVVNQSDLPRLLKGGADLVFGAICLMPEEMDLGQETKVSLTKIHLDFYDYLLEKSAGQIKPVLQYSDIEKIDDNSVGLLKHLEGFYFEKEWDNFALLDYFYNRGVRSISLTHNKANDLAGGAGENQGLTDYGRQFIDELQKKNIVFDLAHIGEKSFWDIMDCKVEYPIMSHTQLKSIHNHQRNVTDQQLKALADRGGLIAPMPHANFLGSSKLVDYVWSIKYLKKLVGIEAIALGSDFDGFSCKAVVDWFAQATDYPNLIKWLEKEWFSSQEIEKIMGENVKRILEVKLR